MPVLVGSGVRQGRSVRHGGEAAVTYSRRRRRPPTAALDGWRCSRCLRRRSYEVAGLEAPHNLINGPEHSPHRRLVSGRRGRRRVGARRRAPGPRRALSTRERRLLGKAQGRMAHTLALSMREESPGGPRPRPCRSARPQPSAARTGAQRSAATAGVFLVGRELRPASGFEMAPRGVFAGRSRGRRGRGRTDSAKVCAVGLVVSRADGTRPDAGPGSGRDVVPGVGFRVGKGRGRWDAPGSADGPGAAPGAARRRRPT